MKNKLKFITTILVLLNLHAFAQHGHSINSNSIIHQQPRMNGAAHANTSAINHTNSNSIFGNLFNHPKHEDRRENQNGQDVSVKVKNKTADDESKDKRKKSKKDK